MNHPIPVEERVFPERFINNEKISMHYYLTAHRDVINWYGYAGKHDFSEFRILVIGKEEIGDSTVMLAETFADTGATIIHADNSSMYLDHVKQRLEVRNICNVECVNITESSLKTFQEQKFDFIASTNLGFISEDEENIVALLHSMLTETGIVSLQLDGYYANQMLQNIRQLISPFHKNIEGVNDKIESVKLAFESLKDYPIVKSFLEKHPNILKNDHSLYHALIKNGNKKTYRVGDIYNLAEKSQFEVGQLFGLDVTQGNYSYDYRLYVKDNTLKESISSVPEQDVKEFAEQLNGKIHFHHVYLAKNKLVIPSISEEYIPFLLFFQGQEDEYQAMINMICQHEGGQFSINRAGGAFTFPVPKYSSHILKFIDGKRTIKEILDSACESVGDTSLDRKQLMNLFSYLYDVLSAQNWMLLGIPEVSRSRSIYQIQTSVAAYHKQKDAEEQEEKLDEMIKSDSFNFGSF